MKKKVCMYPLCANFDPNAKKYCCNGCSWDHRDYIEIHGDDRNSKNTVPLEMTDCLEAVEKIIPPNLEAKNMWFKALASMRGAIRLQKTSDLNEMLVCLETVEKIVPLDLGIKRIWTGALVKLREAVRLQKENAVG